MIRNDIESKTEISLGHLNHVFMKHRKVHFSNNRGLFLTGKLEIPADGNILAYAILAHVFTGNKNLKATRYIARCLKQHGIAVLRFDFTGLGESQGEFADSNFSTNVDDILAAARFLSENYEPPQLLLGHSLGGAAVVFAASKLDSIRAIATIGAPSEPMHVTHLLESELEQIKEKGEALVNIGGKAFTIKKQFLDDLAQKNMEGILKQLRKPILVMHSPQDMVVEIENAAEIYHAAFHPKSFISLDGADHMLTSKRDAHYAADLVASWLSRYIDKPDEDPLNTDKMVAARIDDETLTTEIKAGRHALIADESEDIGGDDIGPSPYQLLASSVASSQAMMIRQYAVDHGLAIEDIEVHVDYRRRYASDLVEAGKSNPAIKELHISVILEGDLNANSLDHIKNHASLCPVLNSISIPYYCRMKLESK